MAAVIVEPIQSEGGENYIEARKIRGRDRG